MTAEIQVRKRSPSLKAPKRASAPKTPPTILVVEKQVLARSMLAQYLRDCGYRVFEAGSEREARTILSEGWTAVNVVLVDVQATRSDEGFGLSQWIRRECPNTRVVLTTGIARSTEAAGELCDEGPHGRRPYQPSELEQRIRAALGRRDV